MTLLIEQERIRRVEPNGTTIAPFWLESGIHERLLQMIENEQRMRKNCRIVSVKYRPGMLSVFNTR